MDRTAPVAPDPSLVLADVRRALAEDLGTGDVTAALLPDVPERAYLLCKEDAVIAGRPWFDACHRALDPDVAIDWSVGEGERVSAGTVLALLRGRSRALVSAERTALNFLQTLSGTATTTAAHVDAVRAGGGANHRIGLYDAVMLKENHIRVAGTVAEAIARARAAQPGLPLIVEVETLDQLREALASGCDRILLDDFAADDRREAVRIARAAPFHGRIPLEVSGGVDLDGLRAIAADGVDFVSIGALTKHVRAIDLSMKLGPPPA